MEHLTDKKIVNFSIGNKEKSYKADLQNSFVSDELWLWCFRFRKSGCNNAIQKITEYCGDEPSSVGETDCGCLCGDFYYV